MTLPPSNRSSTQSTNSAGAGIGVLLVNLGTPEKADAKSVRKYLADFLSDQRVVDYPRALWLPILYGVILNTRPAKTAKLYQSIWRHESNESPLRYYTRKQSEHVGVAFGDNVTVDWAMRYGNPSIRERINHLKQKGCERILVVPLYPQYASSTNASIVDEVSRTIMVMPWQPTIRFAPPFFAEDGFIAALENTVYSQKQTDFEKIILSYHGIPVRHVTKGDPYAIHCNLTSVTLRKKMGWTEEFSPMGYQSKFGPDQWLEPSTESLVIEAAQQGQKHIAVMAPAFVADCIETLEEIDIGMRAKFIQAGGQTLTTIPCVNDSAPFIDFLEDFIRRELSGWS